MRLPTRYTTPDIHCRDRWYVRRWSNYVRYMQVCRSWSQCTWQTHKIKICKICWVGVTVPKILSVRITGLTLYFFEEEATEVLSVAEEDSDSCCIETVAVTFEHTLREQGKRAVENRVVVVKLAGNQNSTAMVATCIFLKTPKLYMLQSTYMTKKRLVSSHIVLLESRP